MTLSMAHAWARCMEVLGCPSDKTPLSASLVGSKGVQSTTLGTCSAAGAAGRCQELTYDRLRGSTLDVLSGFTPIAFVSPETPTTQCQWGFVIRVFRLLDNEPSMSNSQLYR